MTAHPVGRDISHFIREALGLERCRRCERELGVEYHAQAIVITCPRCEIRLCVTHHRLSRAALVWAEASEEAEAAENYRALARTFRNPSPRTPPPPRSDHDEDAQFSRNPAHDT